MADHRIVTTTETKKAKCWTNRSGIITYLDEETTEYWQIFFYSKGQLSVSYSSPDDDLDSGWLPAWLELG